MFFHKIKAFIYRDFIIDSSYKFYFILDFLRSVFPIFPYYFISQMVAPEHELLAKYGTDYFSFAILGFSITHYLMVSLAAFSDTIRRAQVAGCLEAMLSTRTNSLTLIILSPIYHFIAKGIHIFFILVVGGLFLGVDYSSANWLTFLSILILTAALFSTLGILSASMIIIIKKGDPIEWIFGSLLSLLSGAFFPIELLPIPLQKAVQWIPLTHSLNALRSAIFQNASIYQVGYEFTFLGVSILFLLPISLYSFVYAVEKGRKDGSLMHY